MCFWFANLRSQSGDCFDNSVNLRSYFLRRSETLLHLSLASHGRSHRSCTSQQVASCAFAHWSLHLCKASTLLFLFLPLPLNCHPQRCTCSWFANLWSQTELSLSTPPFKNLTTGHAQRPGISFPQLQYLRGTKLGPQNLG